MRIRYVRRVLLILCFLVVSFIGMLFFPTRAIVVLQNDAIIYAFPESEGTFALEWVHSVEKEKWIEKFRVNNCQIFLQSTKFKTFGAGVPAITEQVIKQKNGWLVVDLHREIGSELVVRTTEINHYKFIFKGKYYPMAASDAPYVIKTERVPFFAL
ncbi:DUF1850 domain-containing protein [Virgibacillus dokdonensis]|uniref:DUF1850 domain-containing protein n=1 Tax=Virgibacillus dokdonensis TaxID=302167 RepID=A0A2K9IZC4_9BACI|nr:DUF1850 domain-containing protein [Virgibacillus dokdonensis]AUJ25057.1 hypothetical protein A21D_01976 [Virgibacillus dokdonensis]